MKKYIDKSTIIAEIEKAIDSPAPSHDQQCPWEDGYWCGLYTAEGIIDALEMKEVDLEKDVRQIVSLYYEGIKHCDDIIKEERKENGGSDLAIKILDGVVDARELGIQYVIDKLKAQKGE